MFTALVLVLAIDPAGQVVLERIHVRRVLGDLAKNPDEIHVDWNAHQVQAPSYRAYQEGRLEHFAVFGGRVKE